MNEHPDNSVQIWQGQPVEGLKMSTDEIRKRAGKFQSTIQWRNVREYAGALVAAGLFGSFLLKNHDTLFRIAFGLFIAGLAYLVFQLQRKGSTKGLPEAMGAVPCLQFYRAELERQRDLLANVWTWYLAPLVPGFAVYTIAFAVTYPHPAMLGALVLYDGVVAALFFLIWKMNVRAARSLQRRIDELYAAQNS